MQPASGRPSRSRSGAYARLATDKQLALLRRLAIPYHDDITRTEASSKISQFLESGK
ncbi:MAG: hypothetical protein IT445_12135 [Phycisphaeraceae bacterium]|nr:hypothetical protein [Phycisphaeraceae bacterium]